MSKQVKTQGEIIYGIRPITEVARSARRKIYTIYTTKPYPKAWATIEQCLPKYPIQKQVVTRDVLTRIAGSSEHQGVVALVQPYPFVKKMFDPKKYPFIVLLDELQDPRNLGAILRTAYGTGVDGVIITKKGGAPLSASAFKATAGLAEKLHIYQASTVAGALDEIQKAGYHLIVASFKGKDARSVDYKTPLCLVIGSEGAGVHKSLTNVGMVVTLPQKESDISYNASVAAGMLMLLIATKIDRI